MRKIKILLFVLGFLFVFYPLAKADDTEFRKTVTGFSENDSTVDDVVRVSLIEAVSEINLKLLHADKTMTLVISLEGLADNADYSIENTRLSRDRAEIIFEFMKSIFPNAKISIVSQEKFSNPGEVVIRYYLQTAQARNEVAENSAMSIGKTETATEGGIFLAILAGILILGVLAWLITNRRRSSQIIVDDANLQSGFDQAIQLDKENEEQVDENLEPVLDITPSDAEEIKVVDEADSTTSETDNKKIIFRVDCPKGHYLIPVEVITLPELNHKQEQMMKFVTPFTMTNAGGDSHNVVCESEKRLEIFLKVAMGDTSIYVHQKKKLIEEGDKIITFVANEPSVQSVPLLRVVGKSDPVQEFSSQSVK